MVGEAADEDGSVEGHHGGARFVERYKREPRAEAEDGDPCVVITRSGRHELRNGKHRAIAARESGRRLRVLVVDEREDEEERER